MRRDSFNRCPALGSRLTAGNYGVSQLMLSKVLLLVMAVASLGTSRVAGADSPRLLTFRNSPTLTEVISLNDQGMILGRHEIQGPGLLSMETYVRVEGTDRAVPIPREFTHVEPQMITQSGHVVGFATRPAGHPRGNQRALVWHVDAPQAELLPLPPGFRGSCAHDSSADAQRISGYVLGRDPPRMTPCVWDRGPRDWTCQLLPVAEPYNPLLTTALVKISDRGQLVAASLVTGYTANGLPVYGLFRWQRNAAGEWDREELIDRGVHLGDINDRGFVAGRVLEMGKHRAFIYDPRTGPQVLPLPTGRDSAYATDVNRHGQVVGVSEDPPGPEGTTAAFLWQNGRLEELPLGVAVAASTANTISDEGRVGGLLVRAEASPDQQAVESYVLQIAIPDPIDAAP